ncbi:polyhydroxyalkanoic acid system family protein [Methylocystis sp. JAN1]|uniref:polyhydroxyalkanoic acid system family protein n=1 Tax=Methylocystis sp. JAN1 TaxID=3397211 RepID=UPI003FA24D07
MANTITVTVPHNLGVETAKKRLAARIEALQREYVDKVAKSDVTWAGDVATIHVAALGQTATAQMTVLADMVRIEVQLPWLLAKLSGALQGFISQNANDVLRISSNKS